MLLKENDLMEGIDRLVTGFSIPLQGAQPECDKIKEEMLSFYSMLYALSPCQ